MSENVKSIIKSYYDALQRSFQKGQLDTAHMHFANNVCVKGPNERESFEGKAAVEAMYKEALKMISRFEIKRQYFDATSACTVIDFFTKTTPERKVSVIEWIEVNKDQVVAIHPTFDTAQWTAPKTTKAIPPGFHTVTPYLVVKGGSKALEFYKKAFGAQVLEMHPMEDGKIMHSLFKVGDSNIMLSDEFPPPQGCGMLSPSSAKGISVALHLYVEDVDAWFDKAVKAGAKSVMPVADTFWGDRYGQLDDPFGHRWSISTHKEDVTPKEMEERAKECCANKL